MPVVGNTERDPAGNPHRNVVVRVRLVAALVGAAPGYVPADDYSIIGSWATRTDSSGAWSVDLVSNEDIAPADTFYQADVAPKIGPAIRHEFAVPDGAGPYRVEDILTDPPANLPTTLGDLLVAEIADRMAADNDEAAARAAEDIALGSAIASEVADRQSAVAAEAAARIADVNAEETRAGAAEAAEAAARAAADATLTTNLAAETAARIAGDASLANDIATAGTNLATETAARIADVNTEETRALAAEATLASNLTAETSARVADVNAEQSRALAAESVLAGDIAGLDADVGTIDTALAAETTARTSADSTLTTNLTTETAARVAADSTLTTNLSAETAARIADVNAEENRALVAESALAGNVTAEQARALAAEAILAGDIAGLGVDLGAIDTALADEVTNRTADVNTEETRALAAEALLVPMAQKGAASGVATLDGSTKVPVAQIPDLSDYVQVVGDQTIDGEIDFTSTPTVNGSPIGGADPDAITDATWTPASIRGVVFGMDALEPEGAVRPDVYAWTTFPQADGALAATEIGNKPWTTLHGTMTVLSNKAKASALDGSNRGSATVDIGTPDFLVEQDFVMTYLGGFIFRVVDSSNYLRCYWYNNLFQIHKVVAGTPTLLVSSAGIAMTTGPTYHLALRVNGPHIEANINGTDALTYTLTGGDETTFGAGTKVGIYTEYADNLFDNFRVRSHGVVDGLGVFTGVNLAPGQAAATSVGVVSSSRVLFRAGGGTPYFENPTSGAALPLLLPVPWYDGVTVFVVGRSSGATTERIVSLNSTVSMSAAVYANEFWPTGDGPFPTGIAMPSGSDGVYGFSASRTGFPGVGTGAKAFGGSKSIFRTRDANSGLWPTTTIADINLLARALGQGSERFTGRVRGVWIIPRYLDDETIRLMRRYLARINNLTLPSDPTQRVIFDGDSLTNGQTGTAFIKGYTDRVMAALTGPTDAYNFAITGQTIPQMDTDAVAQVDGLYDVTLDSNVVVFWAGTNDLSTDSPATVYANIVSYCTARRAAGFDVAVCTLLPKGASAPFETDRQTVNANIRTNWATFADALVDIGADPTIGDPGDQNNGTYYQVDAIHLTEAGQAIVAGLVTTALAGLGVT